MGVVFLVPAASLLVVRQFFTDYGERVTPWEVSSFSEDGRTITVEYSTCRGSGESFDRVEQTETSSAVILTVILRVNPRGDCEDISIYHTTEVELAQPLGDRRLIDGRTGTRPDFGILTPQSQ